ncbi:MAG: alpha/beta hydrolase [Deltaproteobacteria bacterium]
MIEEPVFFESADIKIEGLLCSMPGDRGVVITHPHPLYGGNMYNNVVESLVRIYQLAGYTTLRFNFRSVGSSDGEYDNGGGEREDVKAALHFLREKGKKVLDLAGYSFGSWVNALAISEVNNVDRMVMISPPVAFMDFNSLELTPQIQVVVAGNQDQIAPPELIKNLLPTWNPGAHLEVIDGADHFYMGYTGKLESLLTAYLKDHGA